MRQRLPLILSMTALVVAVFGSTPLGGAAVKLVRTAPPFAKTAGYAKLAGTANNAKLLVGHRASATAAPGVVPVTGPDGKLSPSLGAIGPQGPAGPKGDKGSKGDKGDPGTSGYQIVSASTDTNSDAAKTIGVPCPLGQKAVGGGAAYNLYGPESVESYPMTDGLGWRAYADEEPPGNPQNWALVVWAVCMNVTS